MHEVYEALLLVGPILIILTSATILIVRLANPDAYNGGETREQDRDD